MSTAKKKKATRRIAKPKATTTTTGGAGYVAVRVNLKTGPATYATFWRSGLRFSGEPTILALSDLTAGELGLLRSEPRLIVTPHPGVE